MQTHRWIGKGSASLCKDQYCNFPGRIGRENAIDGIGYCRYVGLRFLPLLDPLFATPWYYTVFSPLSAGVPVVGLWAVVQIPHDVYNSKRQIDLTFQSLRAGWAAFHTVPLSILPCRCSSLQFLLRLLSYFRTTILLNLRVLPSVRPSTALEAHLRGNWRGNCRGLRGGLQGVTPMDQATWQVGIWWKTESRIIP
jgi:hypothetical protein